MRAFVAVEMSEAIRAALGKLITELQRFDAPVKWVKPESIHLTLKFLGDVADASLPAAMEILNKCVAGVAPFQLAVKGAGGFPSLRRPRVLFVGAEDTSKTAAELARRLNREMTRAGVPREDRKFRSHITIGRVRRPRPMGALAQRLEALADRECGSMTVDRIVLMQSQLTATGPIYTPVEHAALKGGAGNSE